MQKHHILLSITVLLSACTYGQQPAPYDVYGTRYYGKNGHAELRNDKNQPANSPLTSDYNSKIDAENSSRIISRPLTNSSNSEYSSVTQPQGKPGEIYSHQLSDGSAITQRRLAPVAIDSDQQVVRVENRPIHSGGSMAATTMARNETTGSGYLNREPVRAEETVPPVEHKDGYINPPEANAERKTNNNLSKIKPVPKPKYQEEESESAPAAVAPAPVVHAQNQVPVSHEKPKIAAKIQKVETAAGSVEKDTPKMAAKQELFNKQQAESEEKDVADDEEEVVKPAPKPAAAVKVAPVKLEPVKAAPAKVAETKESDNETAASDADDDVPPVETAEKPAVAAKASTQAENAKPAGAAKSSAQFIKPVDGVVISEFGNDKTGTFNDGVNIQAPEGTPVKASSGGTVVYSGNQLQGYGNMIIIKHSNGFLSAYSHLKELELKKGDNVAQGNVVGHVGKTGNVDTPQLHFGLRKGREPVDPKGYVTLNN